VRLRAAGWIGRWRGDVGGVGRTALVGLVGVDGDDLFAGEVELEGVEVLRDAVGLDNVGMTERRCSSPAARGASSAQ
jgi:hypothetical protein